MGAGRDRTATRESRRIGTGLLALALLALLAAAVPGSAAAAVKRPVALDGKLTNVKMWVKHRSGSRPPAILLSTRPASVSCEARGFRYRSHDRKGQLRLRLECAGLTDGAEAQLRIRRPYVRNFPLSNGTGTVRVKLDKPPGDAFPLASLTTRPRNTDCEAEPKAMRVTRDQFRARAEVRCRDLPENARGVLAVGGLLAPDHIDVDDPPRTAAAAAGSAERAGRKACEDPIVFTFRDASVTRQKCYTSPTTLGPWQSWFIGSGPGAASAPCQSPWYARSILNLIYPVSLDVDPDSWWYSYYFGVVTNWRAWTDVDFSFAYMCYQSTLPSQRSNNG